MEVMAIIQLIIALPKIFGYLKEFSIMIIALNKRSAEQRHQQAVNELAAAKTKKEVEDAYRKVVGRN